MLFYIIVYTKYSFHSSTPFTHMTEIFILNLTSVIPCQKKLMSQTQGTTGQESYLFQNEVRNQINITGLTNLTLL